MEESQLMTTNETENWIYDLTVLTNVVKRDIFVTGIETTVTVQYTILLLTH